MILKILFVALLTLPLIAVVWFGTRAHTQNSACEAKGGRVIVGYGPTYCLKPDAFLD